MEKKVKIGIAIIVAILCLGAVGYAVVEHENNTQQTNDGGNAIEFYPTDGTTTLVLGAYEGTIPTGEHFTGWPLTKNPTVGQTPDYLSGASIKLSSANSPLTLYATFAYNTYTVVFDGNGGITSTAMIDESFTYNTPAKLTANTYERTGYTFEGWSTVANSSTVDFANESEISNDTMKTWSDGEQITLYAVWSANPYVITYSAGDGTGSPVTQDVTYGDSVTLKDAIFTKDNYTQTGWSDNYTLNETFTYDIAGNLDLTAVYSANTFAVTPDAGDFTTITASATATYGQNYTFSVATNLTHINSASTTSSDLINVTVTIGEGTVTVTDNGNGTYTIDGSLITGDISISTQDINEYSITYVGGNGNSESVTYYYYTLADSYTTTTQRYSDVFPNSHSHGGDEWGYGDYDWHDWYYWPYYGWEHCISAGSSIIVSDSLTLTHI